MKVLKDHYAPAVSHRVGRSQDDPVFTGRERVRRAGHRLDRERAAAVLGRQPVTSERLKPVVARSGPQAKPPPVIS